MIHLFDCIVICSDYMEGVWFRQFLHAISKPMSGSLFIAETTFEHPAVICGMALFLTEFAMIDVSWDFLSPAYVLLDDDLFVCREVNNNKFGILNMIWSLSDWIVIRFNDCTGGGQGSGQWREWGVGGWGLWFRSYMEKRGGWRRRILVFEGPVI